MLRNLIKDTPPLMEEEEEEEEKKPWRQVDSNSGSLDYETVALTNLQPSLPKLCPMLRKGHNNRGVKGTTFERK